MLIVKLDWCSFQIDGCVPRTGKYYQFESWQFVEDLRRFPHYAKEVKRLQSEPLFKYYNIKLAVS